MPNRTQIIVTLYLNLASNFMEKHLMGRQLATFLKFLLQDLYVLQSTNQVIIKDFLGSLCRLLVYADQNKDDFTSKDLIKSVNSLICRLMQIDQFSSTDMVHISLQLLCQQLKVLQYSKIMALLIRCIQRMVKHGRLNGHFQQTLSPLLQVIWTYCRNRKLDDQLIKMFKGLMCQIGRAAKVQLIKGMGVSYEDSGVIVYLIQQACIQKQLISENRLQNNVQRLRIQNLQQARKQLIKKNVQQQNKNKQ